MNSYNFDSSLDESKQSDSVNSPSALFQDGDFVVHFHGCETVPNRDCEKEIQSYYRNWQREVQNLDGKWDCPSIVLLVLIFAGILDNFELKLPCHIGAHTLIGGVTARDGLGQKGVLRLCRRTLLVLSSNAAVERMNFVIQLRPVLHVRTVSYEIRISEPSFTLKQRLRPLWYCPIIKYSDLSCSK